MKAQSWAAVFLLGALLLAGCSSVTAPAMPSTNQNGYSLSRSALHVHYSVIHDFKPSDSQLGPQSSSRLVSLNGMLYGATSINGRGNAICSRLASNGLGLGCGTIFSLTPGGSFKAIHSFRDDKNGYSPCCLTAMDGTLYGSARTPSSTTLPGIVFAMSSTGKEQVLYTFKGGKDGGSPGPIVGFAGSIYGAFAIGRRF